MPKDQPLQHPFLIVMAVIVFAEIMVMLLLDKLHLYTDTLWLSSLFDASTVSLVTITTLNYINRRQRNTQIISHTSLLTAGAIVFSTELLLMQLLAFLPVNMEGWPSIFINSIALAVLSFPFIYWKIFLPVHQAQDTATNHIRPTFIWTGRYAYLIFISFLTIIFFILIHQKQESLADELNKDEAIKLTLLENVFLGDLRQAILDSQILANKTDLEELYTNKTHAISTLQADYLSLLEIMQDYDQLRYIDKTGMERIRIDRHSDHPQIVAQSELQNKQDRYYFQQGMQLNQGEVYVSPLDLNIEKGEIQRPFRPMIRIVSPFFSESGEKQGVVVINLSAKQMFDKLLNLTEQLTGNIMLLNAEGYWLQGVDENKSWGFMFKGRSQFTMAISQPKLWQEMQKSPNNSIASKNGTYVYRTIFPMSGTNEQFAVNNDTQRQTQHWFLVSFIDNATIEAPLTKYRYLLSIIFILLALFGAFITHIQRIRIKTEKKLLQLAHFDNLTGLMNRTFFISMLENELQRSQRLDDYNSALLYLDLDNFKPINDELGHDAGDEALKETGHRLNQSIRSYDHVARLGGDEFAILMSMISKPQDVDELAKRILQCFTLPFTLQNGSRFMGVSIGIAVLDNTYTSVKQAMKAADDAMYQAKNNGKNGYFKAESAEKE